MELIFAVVVDILLAEAIAETGKDVDAYIAMLNNVQVAKKSSRVEVLSYSKDQLIDYIVHTYHREQLNMIDEIDQGLAKTTKCTL